MMDVFSLYFDQTTFEFLLSFLGFVPVGILLGCMAWLFSYFVGSCMSLVRTRL
jgi:hypothetical protein